MYGWFHLQRLYLLRLYPFDSLCSLRVTVIGKTLSVKVKNGEDSWESVRSGDCLPPGCFRYGYGRMFFPHKKKEAGCFLLLYSYFYLFTLITISPLSSVSTVNLSFSPTSPAMIILDSLVSSVDWMYLLTGLAPYCTL